jgi:hypothetical protein
MNKLRNFLNNIHFLSILSVLLFITSSIITITTTSILLTILCGVINMSLQQIFAIVVFLIINILLSIASIDIYNISRNKININPTH